MTWCARQFGIAPRQSVLSALLQQDTSSGNDFWFLVLGWVLQQPLDDAEAGARLMHAIADWCRTRLLQEMPVGQQRHQHPCALGCRHGNHVPGGRRGA